jgi:hypothetical protein
VAVVWWLVTDDGAVHAFPKIVVGQRRELLTTVCQRDVFAFNVERTDRGPRCLACRLMVGPS